MSAKFSVQHKLDTEGTSVSISFAATCQYADDFDKVRRLLDILQETAPDRPPPDEAWEAEEIGEPIED